MDCDQELKWLAINLYPLSFFLYSPFQIKIFRVFLKESTPPLRMHSSKSQNFLKNTVKGTASEISKDLPCKDVNLTNSGGYPLSDQCYDLIKRN